MKRMTAREERGRFGVALDRPRYLRYSLFARGEFEAVTGFDPVMLIAPATPDGTRPAQPSTVRNILALFWAGLLDEDETLTRRQVSDLIEAYAPGDTDPERYMWAFKTAMRAFIANESSADPDQKKTIIEQFERAVDGIGARYSGSPPKQESPRENSGGSPPGNSPGESGPGDPDGSEPSEMPPASFPTSTAPPGGEG